VRFLKVDANQALTVQKRTRGGDHTVALAFSAGEIPPFPQVVTQISPWTHPAVTIRLSSATLTASRQAALGR
jgi:hypothetical protein